jgi:hypothetical protein
MPLRRAVTLWLDGNKPNRSATRVAQNIDRLPTGVCAVAGIERVTLRLIRRTCGLWCQQAQPVVVFAPAAFRDNRPMGLRILGINGCATIAESTDDRPVCQYCEWLTLESIILASKKLEEFVCHRHLIGSPNLSTCDWK